MGPRDYVLCADEKTSIQVRRRRHPDPAARILVRPMHVEHEYERGGAWAVPRRLGVHRAQVFGRCEAKTGKAPSGAWSTRSWSRSRTARRAACSGSSTTGPSHRGQPAVGDCEPGGLRPRSCTRRSTRAGSIRLRLFRVSCGSDPDPGSETQILQARAGDRGRPTGGRDGLRWMASARRGRPSPRRSDAHRPRAGPTGPPRAPGGLSGLGAGPPSEGHRLPTQDPEEPVFETLPWAPASWTENEKWPPFDDFSVRGLAVVGLSRP